MPSLNDTIGALFGSDVHILNRQTAYGGCINDSASLTLSNGITVFLKANSIQAPNTFYAEAQGLKLLQCAQGPRVPDVLCQFNDKTNNYLLLEHIASAPRSNNFDDRMGHQLAWLHRKKSALQYGLNHDNFIGASPQSNSPSDAWISFFTNTRLGFQMELARKQGLATRELLRLFDSLRPRLPQLLLEPPEGPTLVHGDLWSGNFMSDETGGPVIVDPAVYYGHREVDLAMTELFGRQPGRFYNAYNEVFALEPGYNERKDLYNLYHIINHLNLFGASYLHQAIHIMKRFV